jgi:hypothetical protein
MPVLLYSDLRSLPPLENYKFTGKPIKWPQFIERFRDQVHNKTTLTDSDRMTIPTYTNILKVKQERKLKVWVSVDKAIHKR